MNADENTCRQLVGRILSIISKQYNVEFAIEVFSDKVAVRAGKYALCMMNSNIFFDNMSSLIDSMLHHPFGFIACDKYVKYDVSKMLGSTIEELMVSCDLMA